MSMEIPGSSRKNETSAQHSNEPLVRFSCFSLARIAYGGKYALLPAKANRSNPRLLPPNRNIRIHSDGLDLLSETYDATFDREDDRIFTVPQSKAPAARRWFEQRLPDTRETGVEGLVERELIDRRHLFEDAQAEGYTAEFAGIGGRVIQNPHGSKVPQTLQLFEVHDLTLPDEAMGALLDNVASDEPTVHFFTESQILHRRGGQIDDMATFLFRHALQS